MKRFGTFTLEPLVSSEGNARNKNAASVSLRPCFIPSEALAKHLGRTVLKNQLDVHVEGSIYQQGVRVSYLNPVPIAKGCYYNSDFVQGAMDAIFKGIEDLAFRGYNMEIDLEEFCVITVNNRSLKFRFSPSLAGKIQEIEKAYPLKSVNGAMSAAQTSNVHAIVHAKRKCSKLDTLQRPNSSMLKDIKQRIDRLTESSKDMSNININ